MEITDKQSLESSILTILRETPIVDMHTHLAPEEFHSLLLLGVDELLTYHYLAAETLGYGQITARDFYALPQKEQADEVWKTLFLEHTPISEACRGVLTALRMLGAKGMKDLDAIRAKVAEIPREEYVNEVFKRANVKKVVMTNDPFLAEERNDWLKGIKKDERFGAALRLDALLLEYKNRAVLAMREMGYTVEESINPATQAETRRFLKDWILRMNAEYMAVSLEDDFMYPARDITTQLLRRCVLPVAREMKIPLALMIGVRRRVNPEYGLAGDGLGQADLTCLQNICAENPDVRIMATLLSLENQHQLAVLSRKFSNLLVFGCWWFLNNPSLIREITEMRFEMLGMRMVPQHSDARVLDQLLYKWEHSRRVIAKVMAEKYYDLWITGWKIEQEDIRRDAQLLLGGTYELFRKG